MKRWTAIIVTVGVVALFTIALSEVYRLRFKRGDFYPRYSSFRTDPHGTRVLYDSLGTLLNVKRNFRPLRELEDKDQSVVFIIGISEEDFLKDEFMKDAFHYLLDGGNLVVTMNESFRTSAFSTRPPKPTPAPGAPAPPPSAPADQDVEELLEQGGWKLQFRRIDVHSNKLPLRAVPTPDFKVDESIDLYSNYCFEPEGDRWQILMVYGDDPAAVSRSFGKGRLTVFANSFFLSNEAMASAVKAKIPAYLVGDRGTVILDEHYKGVIESHGIMWLAKKYQLGLLGIVIGGIVILIVWRNMLVITGARLRRIEEDSVDSAHTSASGLQKLLRRCIKRKQLLKVCHEEYMKTAQYRNVAPEIVECMEVLVDKGGNSPVDAYNEINELFKDMRR